MQNAAARTRTILSAAMLRYDRKESTKRGHNPNAIGMYLKRLDDIEGDILAGADPRAAVVAGLTGHLLDFCLRALGEAIGR